ncbi:hypothetical protein [Roseovarius pacificus]|uniref:hypothetical protein n=1 Tax=Roseovarius pacificus TaxID=337701 RepID=UPI002A188026|nr:hypothetical protein [Roseovarius pacificus]
MDNASIVQLAGNMADWLLLVQGMSPEEIAAVGDALSGHAAYLAREESLLPEAFANAARVEAFVPCPAHHSLNN